MSTPKKSPSGVGDASKPDRPDPAPRDSGSAPEGLAPTDLRSSALSEALATVGDRWTLLVIAALLDGPGRFGDLQDAVQGIAPNILTQRLRHLERHGLLVPRPYSRRPPRFSYELTVAGAELAGVLRLLADWGARSADEGLPRHAVCGTPVEAVWWCPICERPLDDQEIGEVDFA